MTTTPKIEPDDTRETETVTTAGPTVLLNGRYQVGSELGRGGFAITYIATDTQVASRRVVVKLLNEKHSRDPWSLRKLRDEMEALSRIDHPNVVGVIDYGESTDRKQFLVMKFVPGTTLRKMIPSEGLPFPVIAEIARQMGKALTAAHQAGVIHRDIKPENVMIQETTDRGRQVTLIDFGVASLLNAEVNQSSERACGTYAYMAPEQFEGECSPASDVYQMGVVAYEMLTGNVPFNASTPASVALQQREGLKVPPSHLRPDIHSAAEQAILKALSPDSSKRFQSAKAFGDILADALDSGETQWPVPVQRTSAERSRVQSSGTYAMRMIASAAILTAIAIAATYVASRPKSQAADSVAVLPFENRTGDPALAYLADGITESLIGDLSRIPTLRVSGRGAVLKYEGRKLDAPAAGHELGVSRIIDGSVSKRDGGLFVDTELIDVRTGARVWGNSYSASPTSISEMLRQFSNEATDQLRLKLSPPLRKRLERQYSVGSASYELYLKARFHLNRRTASDFDQAIHYFETVVASDPDYAPAYAGLASTYAHMASFGPFWSNAEPKDALERARTAASRALALDGTLAEAYNSLAMVEVNADYQWANAERDYLRSIELDPNFGETHENYALELAALGRSAEAIHEVNRAEQLDPENSHYRAAHGLILYLARRYDESLKILLPIAGTPEGAARVADMVAADYWMKLKPTEALKALDWIPQDSPELRVPLTVTAWSRLGQMDKARALYDEYFLHDGKQWWYYLAIAHLNLGRRTDAVRDMENAYRQRWGDTVWIGVDPLLAPLRSEPGYRHLLEITGLASVQP